MKTKNLLFGAVAALLVVALWYTQLYTRWEKKASDDRAAAHVAQTTADNLRRALKGTSTKTGNKAGDVPVETLLAALPADSAEASFLRQLDTLAAETGIGWQSVAPNPPTAGAVTTVNVSITAQGTEDQITRYMSGLASMKRIFVLDSVNISPTGSTAAAGSAAAPATPAGATFQGSTFSAQLTGRVFSQGATAAATTSGAGAPASGAPAPTGATGQTGVQNG